jgi:hypothetical protein
VTVPRFRLTSPKLKNLRENDVERACIDVLRLHGYYVLRQQTGLFKTADGRWVRTGEVGLPDYAVIHKRYPGFLLEVKATRGELKEHQIKKIFELEMGYRIAVAVVNDVSELSVWLMNHERKAKESWQERAI